MVLIFIVPEQICLSALGHIDHLWCIAQLSLPSGLMGVVVCLVDVVS